MDNKGVWKKFNGSAADIVAIRTSKSGWIARVDVVGVGDSVILDEDEPLEDIQSINSYLICNPHPLAAMIQRWTLTGQPVWIRITKRVEGFDSTQTWTWINRVEIYVTTKPDWHLDNAEYSFTEFED